MMPPAGKIAAFAAGVAVAAAVWSQLDRGKSHHPPAGATADIVASRRETPWDTARLKQVLGSVDAAPTATARLEAARHLEEIPIANIQEALEMITHPDDLHDFSLSAKVLLVRWGGADGDGATRWAWQRFPRESMWESAFLQIGPAWEWHDPVAFGNWALGAPLNLQQESPAKDSPGNEPMISPRLLAGAGGWLVKDQPRLAFQVQRKSKINNAFDSDGREGGLQTAAEARDALSAFDHLDTLLSAASDPSDSEDSSAAADPFSPNPSSRSGPDRQLEMEILQRWKDVDPADFRQSEYASLIPDPPANQPRPVGPFQDIPPDQRVAEADRFMEIAHPEARDPILGSLVKTWSEQDPQQCIQWIGNLTDEVGKRTALFAYLQTGAATDLGPTLDQAEALSGPVTQGILPIAFHAWQHAHPGETPDQTGWPQSRIRNWNDLRALQQAGGR